MRYLLTGALCAVFAAGSATAAPAGKLAPNDIQTTFFTGSRVILPSAVNTIVYLMFCGVEEVNGWPVKNVV